jgi:hypothetical protein
MTGKLFDFKLDSDPRWRQFNGGEWVCASCHNEHRGVFDLACDKPDFWQGTVSPRAPNATVNTSRNFLSEDFCVIEDRDFFVRCVLVLPILGTTEKFGYGVWSTLSKENFANYVAGFDDGTYDGQGPWFGWFSNDLKGYPTTLNMKCNVHLRAGRQRPYLELHDIDHPLVDEQRDGISFDRLLDIYALHGHDIRPALSAT